MIRIGKLAMFYRVVLQCWLAFAWTITEVHPSVKKVGSAIRCDSGRQLFWQLRWTPDPRAGTPLALCSSLRTGAGDPRIQRAPPGRAPGARRACVNPWVKPPRRG